MLFLHICTYSIKYKAILLQRAYIINPDIYHVLC